jgi:hypothetical protein
VGASVLGVSVLLAVIEEEVLRWMPTPKKISIV